MMESWLSEYARFDQANMANVPHWLSQSRQQGIDHFSRVGFPGPRDEQWKYTNVAAIKKRQFRLASFAQSSLSAADLEAFRFADLDTHEMVFLNGHYHAELSDVLNADDGIVIRSLAEWLAAGHDQDLSIDPGENVFASLNNAFIHDGAIVHLAENACLQKPLHLIFVSSQSDEDEQSMMNNSRVDIRLAAHAEAKVIESYVAIGESQHLTNVVTNIVAAENSQLEHYRIQDESDRAYHIANLFIDQKKDSRVSSHSFSLGAALARVDYRVALAETGSENILNGLFMARDRQHTDHHLLVDHLSPHTRSEEYFKGVLDHASRGVFNGKVIVHPDAQKIEAIQSNKNLLLSANAEIDTKPELEIYADDVKCSHGATIGRLNDAELFYLQSRGIHEQKARALLSYAFADDVMTRISLLPVRQYLERKVIGQLSVSDQIDDLSELL